MKKALLVGMVLVAVFSLVTTQAVGREPLCPSGRDYYDGDDFFFAYNEAEWLFEGTTYARLVDRRNTNEPKGRAKGHIILEPDLYILAEALTTDAPVCSTNAAESSLYGDWKAREAVAFGVDLLVDEVSLGLAGGRVSLVLVNDSGTPGYEADDCQVYFASGRHLPDPDPRPNKWNWQRFEMLVPSDSTGLPQPNLGGTCPYPALPCWGVYQSNDCPTKTDYDLTWSTVIQDVDRIKISFGHPEHPGQEQTWSVGIDNLFLYSCLPN